MKGLVMTVSMKLIKLDNGMPTNVHVYSDEELRCVVEAMLESGAVYMCDDIEGIRGSCQPVRARYPLKVWYIKCKIGFSNGSYHAKFNYIENSFEEVSK